MRVLFTAERTVTYESSGCFGASSCSCTHLQRSRDCAGARLHHSYDDLSVVLVLHSCAHLRLSGADLRQADLCLSTDLRQAGTYLRLSANGVLLPAGVLSADCPPVLLLVITNPHVMSEQLRPHLRFLRTGSPFI